MSRLINHFGSFFPKLQKDFRIYDGEVFSEVYEGDFYEKIPYEKIINYNISYTKTDFVSVKDFGAVPDDFNINNAEAINAAIDRCSENGGGVVVVSGGKY